jgi:hypothetical protein
VQRDNEWSTVSAAHNERDDGATEDGGGRGGDARSRGGALSEVDSRGSRVRRGNSGNSPKDGAALARRVRAQLRTAKSAIWYTFCVERATNWSEILAGIQATCMHSSGGLPSSVQSRKAVALRWCLLATGLSLARM